MHRIDNLYYVDCCVVSSSSNIGGSRVEKQEESKAGVLLITYCSEGSLSPVLNDYFPVGYDVAFASEEFDGAGMNEFCVFPNLQIDHLQDPLIGLVEVEGELYYYRMAVYIEGIRITGLSQVEGYNILEKQEDLKIRLSGGVYLKRIESNSFVVPHEDILVAYEDYIKRQPVAGGDATR